MADYLNVDESEFYFGHSTTQNIYVLGNAMRPMWNDSDKIIISCQDREANALNLYRNRIINIDKTIWKELK